MKKTPTKKQMWTNLPPFKFEIYEKYVEPERDEQGVFYAYKTLKFKNGRLFSPVRISEWSQDGFLESDRKPTKNNTNGIYFCKEEQDSELTVIHFYYRDLAGYPLFIVKCALSGIVVEGKTGFRSQYAQIIAIEVEGEWISYGKWRHYDENLYEEKSRDFSGW